jgi:hypothetical protein
LADGLAQQSLARPVETACRIADYEDFRLEQLEIPEGDTPLKSLVEAERG